MLKEQLNLVDTHGRRINIEAIKGLIDLLVKEWAPVSIRLFGSRARGEANEFSDWDLFVVVPDHESAADDPLAGWQLTKQLGIPSDVVLCRRTEFDDASNTPNTLAYEASHNGVLIHGI